MSVCIKADKSSYYQKWMNVSSEKLLERGDKFIRLDNQVDSALVCFSIVNNRYNAKMSDSEKLLCSKAAYGKWYIYFARIFDYSKAYESLLNAKDIINEADIDYPELNMAFAIFYHTLAGHSYDEALEMKAFEYCKSGFWTAYKLKNYKLLDVSFCNIMLMAENLNKITAIEKEWEVYSKIKNDGVYTYDFNILQYNARILKEKGDYAKALIYADKLIKLSKQNKSDLRRIDITHFLKARIHLALKDYKLAISVLHDNEKIMQGADYRDCRLETYYYLKNYYNEIGDKENSNEFGNKYYQLKDSLINLKQMTNVNKMSFINEIKKMDNELNEMKYKRNFEIIFVALSTIFSSVLLVFVGMLFYNNRQLKSKNRKLYERNIEMMNSEDMEIKSLTGKIDVNAEEYSKPVNTEEANEEDLSEDAGKDRGEEEGGTADVDGEKYKNSSLGIEDKKELLAKILGVMENVDEICSLTFSAERLAQLTGSKYKYVSQVINEKYGCNFNVFLNKFRIKEACRRFSDIEKYGQYTIDAMSQSLGFKSRTTFTSSFKKIIGITPSQYAKLAKEDKEKASLC